MTQIDDLSAETDDIPAWIDPVSNTIAGRYRIEKTLSRRASASTLLCVDEETDNRCVVKTFSQLTPADRERLRARVSRLQRLEHEGVARCLGFVEEPACGVFAIVCEWVDGQTAAEMITDGKRFTDDEIYACLREVLTALVRAEGSESVGPQNTVIHRDIKPHNLVHTGERFVLIDFDAATEHADEVGNASVVGTTGYAGPEQFVGRALPASDQYGLAATALHMATHRHPADFPLKNLRIDLSQTELAPPLRRLLTRMLEPQPEDRFADHQSALAAVESSAHEEPWQTALAPLCNFTESIVQIEPHPEGWKMTIGSRLSTLPWVEYAVGTACFLWLPAVFWLTPWDPSQNATLFTIAIVLTMGTWALWAALAFDVFKRFQLAKDKTTVFLGEERWCIETVGPSGTRTLEGTRETPISLYQVRRGPGLVAGSYTENLTFGTTMMPVEADAVHNALRQWSRARQTALGEEIVINTTSKRRRRKKKSSWRASKR
jgi:serine/threonine protein kinase